MKRAVFIRFCRNAVLIFAISIFFFFNFRSYSQEIPSVYLLLGLNVVFLILLVLLVAGEISSRNALCLKPGNGFGLGLQR